MGILIFIIAFVCFILLIILFSACGPSIRHNTLINSTPATFINNYRNKRKNTDGKVIVSFTTTPNRIKFIRPMLNSLLDQSVRIDQISLNIPTELKGPKYVIPEECKNICNIYTAGKDYGIGTKFIPTLLRESECGTKIIWVDDDYVYGYDLIEKLIDASNNNPNKSIHSLTSSGKTEAILIKPEFIKNLTNDNCDDEWLIENLTSDKHTFKYNKNKKYF